MHSCDTFVLGKDFYKGHCNFFAKNSDRPLGESQPISFFCGGKHQAGEMVQCTNLILPQVEKIYSVLGSRPYWIWGFEMGLNECGLFIGNEAQGSRCEAETEEGILGMDLLRLALERADTARKGIEIITSLLEQYGQNANASQLFDRRYENSYLLLDRNEIWKLETAGRQWVAKMIDDWTAFSNCYSIGTDYDMCSEHLEEYARTRKWLHPEETFDFAKAYTLPAVRQGYSTPRWRILLKLISDCGGPLDKEQVKAILRDHFESEIIEPRWGGSYGCFVSICMHAMTWDSTQTAASLLGYWDETLGPVSWYAASIPCCSVYIPVYWYGDVPHAMKNAGEFYDENSLWWVTERLAMLVSIDEERFGNQTREALHNLEKEICLHAKNNENEARGWIEKNKEDIALEMLAEFTEQSVEKTMTLVKSLSSDISKQVSMAGGLYGPRKEFLEAYTKRTKMPLLENC